MASLLFFCGAMDGCLPCLSGWKPAWGASQCPSSGKPLPQAIFLAMALGWTVASGGVLLSPIVADRRTRPCLSPSPLAQAIQEIGEFREKFGIGGAHRSEDEWASTAKLARCTFVEGLLIHAFKAPRDKVTLRNQVQKHLKLLGNGATKDDLAPCLRIRADRALKFQIPL